MSGGPRLDGRRASALEAELLRRADAVLDGRGIGREVGISARAVFAVAARISEEVTRRLDRVPDKQLDNFYSAAGIGRDPAQPASLPVAFKLADGAAALVAPRATQLMATAKVPVVFETVTGIDLVPGRVAVLRGVDALADRISIPSGAVIAAKLPRSAPMARRLRGVGNAGTIKLQIDPVTGLEPGTLLALGAGAAAREHKVSVIDGEVVTIEPALETNLPEAAPATEVTVFAPFAATTCDHQAHAFYLGHSSHFDLPSATEIVVSGAPLPADAEWSWWGKLGEDDAPAWQNLGSGQRFTKLPGKLVKKKIRGHETLWLRARLVGKPSEPSLVEDVRVAIGEQAASEAGYVAIANTTPVVANRPFHPFGREPRLFDVLHIGSDEVFAKAGARATLDFRLAGADLGPLVGQADGNSERLFGVGSDGLLHRVTLPAAGSASAIAFERVPSPTDGNGIVALDGQSPLACWTEGGAEFVAAVAGGSIRVARIDRAGAISATTWKSLPFGNTTRVDSLAVLGDGAHAKLFARSGEKLLVWDQIADGRQPRSVSGAIAGLLAIDQSTSILVATDVSGGRTRLSLGDPDFPTWSGTFTKASLPGNIVGASQDFDPQGALKALYIAGYDPDQDGFRLVLTAIETGHPKATRHDTDQTFSRPLPVAFEAAPAGGVALPRLKIADTEPVEIGWQTNTAGDIVPVPGTKESIGYSPNPHRKFRTTPSYEVVQRADVGLAYRTVATGVAGAVGPDRASNPTLSWEYWNGTAWWALGGGTTGQPRLNDETGNFGTSGKVSFSVPADLAPTEVGGTKAHWIRVRLVGGDYGEAEVRELVRGGGVFRRDISTIRAPLVISLRLGYSAPNPVRPEVILTEDSLGMIEQTGANDSGLAFAVFSPVAELMNPPGPAAPTGADAPVGTSCDDGCPQSEEDIAAPVSQAIERALIVGFDRAFAGQTVALYIDAIPSGQTHELIAEVLRDGLYRPVNVVSDTSHGLGEPGILTLALPQPPDLVNLLGETAHWLRLRPRRLGANWSPQLRAIHLNAATARSVETRAMERLGQSLAIEDQEFRLAEGPVRAGSLILRVREPLGEEELAAGTLDVAQFPGGPPGDWVRWYATDDLAAEADPQRVFAFDADRGVIRFGDGRTGQIPPLGAEVLAERYLRVTGAKANGIAPGAQLPPLTLLAGVESARALDLSAGGSDVEALDLARRRAAAKVRHGNRILTRADLEDYGLTLSPWIAQVKALPRRGGTRLIVVMKGEEARPLPAQLRGFESAVRAVAGFGLARADGLEAAAPRLLPLAIGLRLRLRPESDFTDVAGRARDRLRALFDPATGNHDGAGWPLGRLPDEQDIAAALIPLEPQAMPDLITLGRAGRNSAEQGPLPARLPADVLVRLDLASLMIERVPEAVP